MGDGLNRWGTGRRGVAGWACLFALVLLILLLGVPSRAAAQGAPAVSAPPATGPRVLTCDSVTSRDVAGLKRRVVFTQILSQPRYLPRGSTASLLVRKAGSESLASFKAVVVGAGGDEPLEIEEVRDGASEQVAEGLDPAQRPKWQQLVVTVPDAAAGWNPLPRRQNVVVFGCRSDGSVAVVGRKVLGTTAALPAKVLAVSIIALIYAILVTVVWLRRRNLAHHEKQPQPPLRWQDVRPLSWWRCADPVVLTGDIFDRGSLTKLQVLLFTLIVVFEIIEVLLRTGILSDLSPSIIALLGIPAVGSILSQAASLSKDRLSAANWAWLTSRGVLPLDDRGIRLPQWSDLFMSDAELDLYKVQAAAFSLVVATSFLLSGMDGFRDFAVPDSLLQILGLSQIVLVGGRFTKPSTLKELDELVTELKKRQQVLRIAAATGVDVDADGKPVDPPPPPASGAPFTSVKAAETGVPNAAARYRELVCEVDVLLESLTHRDVDSSPLLDPDLGPRGAPPAR